MSGERSLLEVIEARDTGSVRVCLRGDLDLAGASRLTESLTRLAASRDEVLLDLDELAFIDMSGLRAVLRAAESAAGDGRTFTVTRGSAPVRRLIALVDLDGHLAVDGSPA